MTIENGGFLSSYDYSAALFAGSSVREDWSMPVLFRYARASDLAWAMFAMSIARSFNVFVIAIPSRELRVQRTAMTFIHKKL